MERYIIALFSGPLFADTPWALKVHQGSIAAVFLAIFSVTFFFLYKKFFWKSKGNRHLFVVSVVGVIGVVLAKLLVFYFVHFGYVADRLFFYAIPSPKFTNMWWATLALVSLIIFFVYRPNIFTLKRTSFLLFLYVIFGMFSLGIAGMRLGSYGIFEPFTRVSLDYASDLPLVKNIPQLFHQYVSLNQELSVHGRIHPPGNLLFLFIIKNYLRFGLLGMAVVVVLFGGACLFPVFYFWRCFYSEQEVRAALAIFIFTPSLVMFSALSMDILLVTCGWLSLCFAFLGWKRNWLVSLIGGFLFGGALLLNFLYAIFSLVFLYFFIYLWSRTLLENRRVLFARGVSTVLGFILFYCMLFTTTSYSVVENFFVANRSQHLIVASNFVSVQTYLAYVAINIFSFIFYLGLSSVALFAESVRHQKILKDPLMRLGFFLLFFLLAIGIFQGETERIWLFVIPLFFPVLVQHIREGKVDTGAVTGLLIFQIVIVQTLWYTYW